LVAGNNKIFGQLTELKLDWFTFVDMRLALILFFGLALGACKKYKDPEPFTDPRIKNKYCNDPSAINYNWDFPGVADNSTCIYPAEIFAGQYFYRDSLFNATGEVVKTDSFPLSIQALDSVNLTISGFCASGFFTAKASRFFQFTIDSLLGNGQEYCGFDDTLSGKGVKSGIADTTLIKFTYQIQTDTGLIQHAGTATKL
jgi:hypothetical protein